MGLIDSSPLFSPGSPEHAAHRHFIGWQCRVRQAVMRYAIGRPSEGMRPHLWAGRRNTRDNQREQNRLLGQVIVLINKAECEPFAKQFRHMVLKTQDPNERYDAALSFFSALYYQRPHEFSGTLTALFGPTATVADQAIDAGICTLTFDEYRQRYALPCQVRELNQHDVLYQATYWHNRLFNPNMPAGVRVIAFEPDWVDVDADPPIR